MKQIILFGIVWFYAGENLGQNSSPAIRQTISSAVDDRWDLNKFVWSHTYAVGTQTDKPVINFDAMDSWEGLLGEKDVTISRDGKYFAYGTKKGTNNKLDSLIVQSTTRNWRQAIKGAKPGFFTGDNEQYIYQDKKGLCFLQLGSNYQREMKSITSYKVPDNGRNEWLACLLENKELVLQHLATRKEKRFEDVAAYEFDKNSRWLVVQLNNANKELLIYDLINQKENHFMGVLGYLYDESSKIWVFKTIEKRDSVTLTALKVVNLVQFMEGDQAGSIKTIWSSSNFITVTEYCVDASGKQVGFILQDEGNKTNNSIWFWREGMDKPELKLDNQTNILTQNFLIQGPILFARNTKYIQFYLQPKPDFRQPRPDEAQITVWSYQDTLLQLAQQTQKSRLIAAVLNCENRTLIRLKAFESLSGVIGNQAIVFKNNKQANGDRFWEKDYRLDSCWLVSLENGNRKFIARGNMFFNFCISPDSNYFIFYDRDKLGNYFSYDFRSERLLNVSKGIPAWQFRILSQEEMTERSSLPAGIAGWLKNRAEVLVYDNYDIWLLDLTGRKLPVNITNGYGQKHRILFSLMNSDRGNGKAPVLNMYDTLLFRAFDKEIKYNGFYRKILKTNGNPELLYMGPYFFEVQNGISDAMNKGMNPRKAADDNTWIVMRQTVTEAPNYFLTTDFKNFLPLTNYQSQKAYNWLTAELHHFKRLDGSVGQGVLYKPTNFDPAQKYPVIVSFYGVLSNQLYQYPTPAYINAPHIYYNPAWMVSHGYLVFVPDILFTKSKWGPSTVNTIDGAAQYLSGLSYVDNKRLGACGHSNSGRFGYYLLTHTKSFAAISAGSGFCGADVISGALSFSSTTYSNLEVSELESFGAGLGNLWQNKASWIDHSAVLQADRVKCPFLLFHGRKDSDDVRLALELFIALRRLEKTAWWLEYDNGSHMVYGIDAKDFTIRFTQFFDHYLKMAPAPKWMTAGMPYKLKGIETRYELDADGTCAKDCLICIGRRGR